MRIKLLVILLISAMACKQKHTLSGDEPITYADFKEVFPTLKLPFSVSDSNFQKLADTSSISRTIFKQFVPDTIMMKVFGKDTSYKLKPVGRVESEIDNDLKEDYLAVLAQTRQKAAIMLMVFKRDSFSAAMPLVISNKDDIHQTATIDKKLSVVINNEWMKENELMYTRTIYAYNNVGLFTTVVTETNVPREVTAATVLNPIDTFPRQNKYSGDYTKGSKNFISIRDGNSPGEYMFFVHFLNDGDEPCGGDLRGELKMTSETTGVFTANADPCVVDFTFTKNTVKVKEQGSCGNFRGIRCFFDDTFTRKKEPKPNTRK